jgi:8-oxo-dGTP pyrophosphatase MutT (NUDIX family)
MRISVRGIVVKADKLLCVRLKKYNELTRATIEADWWCTPGGGLDDGESLLAAIEREMIEETGVVPVVGDLLYIQQFRSGGKDYMDFFFHITNADDYLDIDLTKTTHGLAEIAQIDFVDPESVTLLPSFLTIEAIKDQIATGQTKIHNFL